MSIRKLSRLERQQAYAAARAAQTMARRLKGRQLSEEEAAALTVLGARAASGSARAAKALSTGGARHSKKRRAKIRRETYGYVRSATGGKRRKGRKASRASGGMTRKERRRINRERFRELQKKTRGWSKPARRRYETAGDYIHFKQKRAETFGPVRFTDQPAWVRRRGRKSRG